MKTWRSRFQITVKALSRLLLSTSSYYNRASRLSGSSDIQSLEDAPGGGYLVTVYDPEGFPVNLIYGQKPAEPGPMPPQLEYNFENDKHRLRRFQRFNPGPAAVHKVSLLFPLSKQSKAHSSKARPLRSMRAEFPTAGRFLHSNLQHRSNRYPLGAARERRSEEGRRSLCAYRPRIRIRRPPLLLYKPGRDGPCPSLLL